MKEEKLARLRRLAERNGHPHWPVSKHNLHQDLPTIADAEAVRYPFKGEDTDLSLQPYIDNAEDRLWRTDLKTGRNVYVLLSNDVTRPSEADPMIGVMETSALAEDVVTTHNTLVLKFGKRYPTTLESL